MAAPPPRIAIAKWTFLPPPPTPLLLPPKLHLFAIYSTNEMTFLRSAQIYGSWWLSLVAMQRFGFHWLLCTGLALSLVAMQRFGFHRFAMQRLYHMYESRFRCVYLHTSTVKPSNGDAASALPWWQFENIPAGLVKALALLVVGLQIRLARL